MKSLFFLAMLSFRIVFAHPATTVPFELFDNRILVDVYVNDKGPFTFLFDTGGGNVITPQVAEKLNLKTKEGGPISGAGDKKPMAGKTHVDKYCIGEMTLSNQDFIVFDLDFLKKAFGFKELDGIFGWQVLEKMPAFVDFENKKLVLGNRGNTLFRKETIRIPFELVDQMPVIPGSINGIPAKLLIDTGDRSSFTLFQKFAKKKGLNKLFEKKPEIVSGYGVGGPIPAKLDKLKQVSLGEEVKLDNVLVRLPTTKRGSFAEMEISGSVGNEILRRFNVLFDYQKKEIHLVKNKQFDSPYGFVPPKLLK